MNIQTKATNLKLTEAIEQRIDKRMKQIEKLLDSSDTSIKTQFEVEMTKAHQHADDLFRAEINLHTRDGDFRSEASQPKLFDAIDEAASQLGSELRRTKNKKLRNVRRGGARIKEMLRNFRGSE